MWLLSNWIPFKRRISTLVFSKSLNIGATAFANPKVQRDHKIPACQGKRASQLTEQLVYELLLGGNCGVTLLRENISFSWGGVRLWKLIVRSHSGKCIVAVIPFTVHSVSLPVSGLSVNIVIWYQSYCNINAISSQLQVLIDYIPVDNVATA